MSKQRGVSLEEKRKRVLDIFLNSGQVFQLKDVEKLAVKAGVTLQSVKDVVQSLIDDNLAHCEKIGISNYYWAFLSDASHSRALTIEALQRQKSELEARLAAVAEQVDAFRSNRLGTDERIALLSQLDKGRKKQHALQLAYQPYAASEPEALAQRRREIEQAAAATNRWTDNIFALQSWMLKQGLQQADITRMFEIPPDLDNV